MNALVLLSGGLDSTVALAEAYAMHKGSVGAISFLYGQKHPTEINAAQAVSDYYGINHQVVTLPAVFSGTGSVLIDDNELEMPKASYQELSDEFGVSPTYVPYRNGNLLSLATAVALVEGAGEVWAGMHAEDAHNWAYPDCTPEFLGAMASAIYVGSYHEVRLITPHMWRTKADVVQSGLDLKAPLELTWSCYEGRNQACGVCPTCVGRIQAFARVGEKDPISYEIEIDWKTVAV
jgi:7-cyano-7-deazaguanine synthase